MDFFVLHAHRPAVYDLKQTTRKDKKDVRQSNANSLQPVILDESESTSPNNAYRDPEGVPSVSSSTYVFSNFIYSFI